MSLKQFLTNLNPFKKKENLPAEHKNRGGRPVNNEPISPKMSVKEAVDALPSDLIDALHKHRSVEDTVHKKLNETQQLELMEFIARFATMDDINEYFVQNYKITLSPPLIYQYKRANKWRPVIKKLREKYLIGDDEVPGRHKRVRLDRADRLFQKAERAKDYKTALQANRDMQEMTEGKHVSQGDINMQFNQYNVLDDEELQLRIKEAQDKLSRKTIEVKPKEIPNAD